MRELLHKYYDYQKDIFVYFVDYEKVFDIGWHEFLIKILQEVGLDN